MVSAAYGRCIEGMRRDEAELRRVMSRDDVAAASAPDSHPAVLACIEARAAWAHLMREVPRFVEVSRG